MQSISQLLEHPSLIAYFSGANNYTWLQFRNGERRLLSKPLTYFEERLPDFIRIHKTALINPACVGRVQHPPHPKMPGTVQMQDGIELPVSRRRWSDVIQRLQINFKEDDSSSDEVSDVELTINHHTPYLPPPLVLLAVMTAEALLITRQRIEAFGLPYQLHHVEWGVELANSLLLNPAQEQPALILLDARTHRPDRILTLRALKSHARLRSIPVVWLTSPVDDTTQAYALAANSVVVVPEEPASFVQVIEQLCRYWLMVVQLPPKGV